MSFDNGLMENFIFIIFFAQFKLYQNLKKKHYKKEKRISIYNINWKIY